MSEKKKIPTKRRVKTKQINPTPEFTKWQMVLSFLGFLFAFIGAPLFAEWIALWL